MQGAIIYTIVGAYAGAMVLLLRLFMILGFLFD